VHQQGCTGCYADEPDAYPRLLPALTLPMAGSCAAIRRARPGRQLRRALRRDPRVRQAARHPFIGRRAGRRGWARLGRAPGLVDRGRAAAPRQRTAAAFSELVGTAISNAQARGELARLIEEQAALRRVATLAARAVAPEVVFAAVTEEVARLVRAHHTVMVRSETHRNPTVVAVWNVEGFRLPEVSGVGESVWRPVLDTGRPARIELQDSEALAGFAADSSNVGIRSLVGCPILVEGRERGQARARVGHTRRS